MGTSFLPTTLTIYSWIGSPHLNCFRILDSCVNLVGNPHFRKQLCSSRFSQIDACPSMINENVSVLRTTCCSSAFSSAIRFKRLPESSIFVSSGMPYIAINSRKNNSIFGCKWELRATTEPTEQSSPVRHAGLRLGFSACNCWENLRTADGPITQTRACRKTQNVINASQNA